MNANWIALGLAIATSMGGQTLLKAGAGSFQQTRQFREHGWCIALRRRRLAGRETHFALCHCETGD